MPSTLVMPATQQHAAQLVPLMADVDRARLVVSPAVSLRLSVMSWCGLHDGVPICLGGIMAEGFIWMISTPELDRHKRAFLRESRNVMAVAATRFAELRAGVETSYDRSLRWMRWLGFHQQGEPIRTQIGGRPVEIMLLHWRRS